MSRWFRETDLGDNLIRLQRSLHQIHKEVISRNGSHTTWPFRHNISLQRQYHTRRICGGIGVCHATTDGTHVPYLLIANEIYSLWQHIKILFDQIRTLNIHILRHRANGDRITFIADIREATDPAKINQVPRLRQAQFHRG